MFKNIGTAGQTAAIAEEGSIARFVVPLLYAVGILATFPIWWMEMAWALLGVALFLTFRKAGRRAIFSALGMLGEISLVLSVVTALVLTPIA